MSNPSQGPDVLSVLYAKGAKLSEDFFCFSWDLFFCFCAFAWSEGTGGREGGTEGGRGVDFSLGNTNSLTFLTDLVPFPLDFPSESVPYLEENVRYLGLFRKTTVFLTFWTDFVPFATFS